MQAHVIMTAERIEAMYRDGEKLFGDALARMLTADATKRDLMAWKPEDVYSMVVSTMNLALFHAASMNASLTREPGDESNPCPF